MDNDGIIADSEVLFYQAVKESFKPYGVDISEERYIQGWMIGLTYSQGVIDQYGLDSTLDDIRKIRNSVFEDLVSTQLQFVHGAEDMLYRLNQPKALVSASNPTHTQMKLEALGLDRYFNVIVAGIKKSDGTPWITACDLLGVNPQDTMVIEDNPLGAQSALGAGVRTVVVYPHGYTSNLEFPPECIKVESLDEVIPSLYS